MDFQELVTGLVQSGFSVGVAAFLLIRLDNDIKDLTKAIEGLKRCQICKVAEDKRHAL